MTVAFNIDINDLSARMEGFTQRMVTQMLYNSIEGVLNTCNLEHNINCYADADNEIVS